jgi:LPS-assembly lipoprotein
MKAREHAMKVKFGLPSYGAKGVPFILHPSSLILLATALLLTACGFKLRGEATLPFATMFVQAPPSSQFAVQLRRAVAAGSQTKIADSQKDAQVTLQILNELREKSILSLSGAGRVSEFQLRYRVSYRLYDGKTTEYIPTSEIVLQRDFSFSDQAALSKESEELLLYRDMQADAVQQLVRRLQVAKLDKKS